MLKNVLRIGFLLVAVVISLSADINFLLSYDEGMVRAQKEKKPIMLTIVTTYCPWCHKMQAITLKDKKISDTIARNFIPVLINKDIDPIPQGLSARMVPTTYFLDSSGKKLIQPAIGYWEAEDFLSFLDDALKKVKK